MPTWRGVITVAPVEEAPIPVAIELGAGLTPIQGRLRIADGTWRDFRGWLELTALLELAGGGESAFIADKDESERTQ